MSDAAPLDAAPFDPAGLPERFAAVVGATPARLADVEAYRLMLGAANTATNLVGASTLAGFWTRHFVDSAQLLWFAPQALRWADLGAGAGLPGVILAILLKDRPGARVHLIDSMAKRCRFLSDVVGALNLPAVVHHARAESLALDVEVVTARACAPLDRLLTYARPYFARGATGLFLKGAGLAAEIETAKGRWRFSRRTLTSLSDPRGRVLAVDRLSRIGGA